MRILTGILLISGLTLAAAALAQPPRGGSRNASTSDDFIKRLMAYDSNGDDKLTKDELADKRLYPLFERADLNNDGVVDKAELKALYERESTALGAGRGGSIEGPGGFGGPGGRGDGGRAPGPRGGPPRPGDVLPSFVQDRLQLNEKQRKQIEALQKEVDAKLANILTPEQKQQFEEMRNSGPGGPRGSGGFGPPNGRAPE